MGRPGTARPLRRHGGEHVALDVRAGRDGPGRLLRRHRACCPRGPLAVGYPTTLPLKRRDLLGCAAFGVRAWNVKHKAHIPSTNVSRGLCRDKTIPPDARFWTYIDIGGGCGREAFSEGASFRF